MIHDWLQPEVCYRLKDLAAWLSLPAWELFFAAERGEIRSLGEGPVHMTMLGSDVVEFVDARGLPWTITAEGRRALGGPRSCSSSGRTDGAEIDEQALDSPAPR